MKWALPEQNRSKRCGGCRGIPPLGMRWGDEGGGGEGSRWKDGGRCQILVRQFKKKRRRRKGDLATVSCRLSAECKSESRDVLKGKQLDWHIVEYRRHSRTIFHLSLLVLECWGINYSGKGRLRLYVPPSILKETSVVVWGIVPRGDIHHV